MAPITLMQNEYVSLWYHPEAKIVHHRLEKFPDSATFRALLTKGAECLEERHAQKWLSDDTNHFVVREDDSAWAQHVWGPRVIRAGFRYWAIVTPLAAVGRLNMSRYAEAYRKLGIAVTMHNDPETALEWLRSL